MTLFYAIVQDEQSDFYRYLITFANREIADGWWRMISTPPSPCAENVSRISPQFYSQKDPHKNTVKSFFATPGGIQFQRKMFITALWRPGESKPFILPPIAITDHISGRWYFIRSNGDPQSHWYLRVSGVCLVCGHENCDAIHVSNMYRTKFCVRVRDPDNASQTAKDFVMVGKDTISISARKDYVIHIDDAGDLKGRRYQGETDLLFSDFQNRFVVRGERLVNGEILEYVESAEQGSGEAWELVG